MSLATLMVDLAPNGTILQLSLTQLNGSHALSYISIAVGDYDTVGLTAELTYSKTSLWLGRIEGDVLISSRAIERMGNLSIFSQATAGKTVVLLSEHGR